MRTGVCLISAAAMAVWATNASAFTDFGQARPVTAKDLAGKKFCWSSGRWTRYAANGGLSNSQGAKHRVWSVQEPGVLQIHDQSGQTDDRYIQMEALADGRVHTYHYCLHCVQNHDKDGWGTPCE